MGWESELTEVSGPSLAYIVLGGFVVAFSMISLLVKEKLYMNEVVLGTGIGILMGPYCANIFDPRSWGQHTNTITLEVTRVVLATGLFAIGVELPKSYMWDHARGLIFMVVPTMAFGWLIIAAITYAIFPPINFISSLVIAACLTPTDPIICAAIVGGNFAIKHVPENLRYILAAESAANDGLAYPFLSISIYLTVEASTRVAIGKWFLIGWLYQVILGTVLGTILGLIFSKLMKISLRYGFIDRESFVAQYLALALFTIGVVSTIGSDDLLAAFAAGSAISWDGHFNTHTEDEIFSSVIDLILNCACFVYIGAWLPFTDFNIPDLSITPWRLILLFLAVIVLRRIPALLVLYKWVPEISGWREALFSGHFGPMGVGAIFISTLALTRLPTPQSPPENQQELLAATLQPIVSFVVLGSILIHGLSIPFFTISRQIGSRTVTLTRTLTSRGGNTSPEWLNNTNRALGVNGTPPSISFSQIDIEAGRDDKRKENIEIITSQVANNEDACMLSNQGIEANDPPIAHLGEVSLVQGDIDVNTTRRQHAAMGPASSSGTSGTPTAASRPSEQATEHNSEALREAVAQIPKIRIPNERHDSGGILHRRVPTDHEDERVPSGAQTPGRSVHFPPSQ